MSQYGVLPPPLHWVDEVQPVAQRPVARLHTRPASPQSLLLAHWTHWFLVVLQRLVVGLPPTGGQLALVVHCTQRFVVVLQAGVPPAPAHWAFAVHDTTQVFVAVSQAMVPASPQLLLLTHWTHVLVAVSQVWRPPPCVAQLVSARQPTHRPVAVSHAGRPAVPAHCVLFVQPATHVFVVGLQTFPPSPQSAVVAHPTHAPSGEQTCLPVAVH